MSVQSKPDYKIFASAARSGEVTTFPDILRGWGVTIDETENIPPMEWFNAIGKRTDEWLLYLTQRGIPEWDSSLDYPKSAVVTHGDVIYISLRASKDEQPDRVHAAWSRLDAGKLLRVQRLITSTTYTPSPGTRFIIVEAVGGGAGGGGSSSPTANLYSAAGGGSAGAYAKAIFYTLPTSPVVVTIGAGGAGGAGGAASSTGTGAKEGSAGGNTSFGSLLMCPGGSSSKASDSFPSNSVCSSEYPHAPNPATVSGGTIIEEVGGAAGTPGMILGTYCISGRGGDSPLGTGGISRYRPAGDLASGANSTGYGAGGGGACSSANTQGLNGGNGGNGCVIVWEYA